MKKIVIKIIAKVLLLYILISLLVSISIVNATNNNLNNGDSNKLGVTTGHSVKEAGETIAAWAINFAEKHSAQARYGGTSGYNLPVSDSDTTTIYKFHCVAFVSFVIHHALGLGGDNYTEFVKCPYSSSGTGNPNNPPLVQNGFERVECSSEEWQPGDIIVMWHHVAVYVGNGMSIGMYTKKLYYGNAASDCNSNGGYQGWVGRITEEAAANASFEYLEGAGVGGVAGLEGSTDYQEPGQFDTEEVDLDEIANKFDFSGMATTVIKENQKADVFSWFFEGIGGFVDYLAGIILTTAIKAPILGYTNTVLNLINSFLHGLN